METTPREVWLQRIEAWKQSGLTAKAFAERNGFNLKTFENRKYCVFHAISITDSAGSRSGIPREADHRFHGKPNGHSREAEHLMNG
jgi:hypothetical protein